MSFTLNPFLRHVLFADAAVSGAAGLLMVAGAPFLSPLLGLPTGLLFYVGLALFPFVALLFVVAWRGAASRVVIIDIIAINACGWRRASGCWSAAPSHRPYWAMLSSSRKHWRWRCLPNCNSSGFAGRRQALRSMTAA